MYSLLSPEQTPLRYWPPAQLTLEHALHLYPFFAPKHTPLRYRPLVQIMDAQVEHAESEVPEQPPFVYLPARQVVHVEQVPDVVADEPFRNWNDGHV